jgi:tRNA pseudouridine38-40 synthase
MMKPASRRRNPAPRPQPSPGDPADPGGPGPGNVRLRIDASYDGTGFHGWSRQPGLRTIQQVLEDALARALSLPGPAPLTVAGRTDAGVHAYGQVAHADVPASAWAEAGGTAVRRLASLLPPDVRVRGIRPAPDGFDARFSALWRRYAYRVCDDPAGPDPLRRHDTLAYSRPIDTGPMSQAARACLGEHDFAAFCRRRTGPAEATTIREVLALDCRRSRPGLVVVTITADAFCHNMVRALVGALLLVGEGRRAPDWVAGLLAAGVRDPAVRVLPPHGLCLEEVGYPADAGLASRAAATRRLRQPLARPGPSERR